MPRAPRRRGDGFKLDGLAAGPASEAHGVEADNRLDATVRNCAIRGLRTGVAGSDAQAFCRDSLIAGYLTPMVACEDNGGNVIH